MFSKIKYRTIPKKAAAPMRNRSFQPIRGNFFVGTSHEIRTAKAMIWRKKAMEAGGSSVRTILVLMKEYPQKITEMIRTARAR